MNKRLFSLFILFAVIISALFSNTTTAFGLDDNLAPQVKSFELIGPKKSVYNNGDTLTFSMEIIDPVSKTSSASGIMNVMVAFNNEDNEERQLYFRPRKTAGSKNLYTSTIILGDSGNTDNSTMRGRYYLDQIYVEDFSYNITKITVNNKNKMLPKKYANEWENTNIYYGIKGVNIHKTYYNQSVTPEFNGKGILNDKPFKSGTTLTKEGSYGLIVYEPDGVARGYDFYIDNSSPNITFSRSITKTTNKDVNIKFKVTDDLSGISTITNVDTNKKITYKKTVKKYNSQFKVKKNGTYVIKATDKAGNNISKKIKVTNIDKKAPGKPSANKVKTSSRKITGKAEKNSTVYVYKGKTKLGSAKVNSKGTYNVKIKKQKKGTKLTIYAIDKAGNKSKTITIKVK